MNSAFIDTELEIHLRQRGIKSVVITALCVNYNQDERKSWICYYLVSDAIAAFEITDHLGTVHPPETVHELELAALHKEFAVIVTADEVIGEMI